MARVMFTDKFVRGVKSAAPGHRDTYWDALVPTFGLRVTDRGVKSYFIMTHLLLPGRNASTQVRRVVGRAALMPLATARKKAREN